MVQRGSVTALPSAKLHVVTAQLHDGAADVIMVRLAGDELPAQWDDGDASYEPGTRFTLRMRGGRTPPEP